MVKTCSRCGLEKDLTDFYRDRRHRDGYRSDCKACHTPVVRKYQATKNGKAVARLSDKRRIGTVKRKASHNRATARYKKTPHGRLVENACSHRRRERQIGLDSTWSKEDILEVYARFGDKCFVCDTSHDLSIDHHRPLSEGHSLCLENAVLLCVSCNASKSTKDPQDFYAQEQMEVLNGLGII